MTQINFDCRISVDLKNKIFHKSSSAGLTNSEFIRIILSEINFNNINDKLAISNSKEKLTNKIRCRLSTDKYEQLLGICKTYGLNISQLIRILLQTENYVISKNDYLELCEHELNRSGNLLNNLAYELNRNALLNSINQNTYSELIIRFIEPQLITKNIISLLKNPPVTSKNDLKILYAKNIQLKWSSNIYRITNNVRQIFKRLITDHELNIINNTTYLELLDILNKLHVAYQEIFVCLKIFNKVVR